MALTELLSKGIKAAAFRAVLALPLAYGCGNTTNNYYGGDGGPGGNGSCAVRETDGCEDFTGVYRLTELCGRIDQQFLSLRTHPDCTMDAVNHNSESSPDNSDCWFSAACQGIKARGNHISVPEYGLEIIKCSNGNLQVSDPECHLGASYVSGIFNVDVNCACDF
ncbi:hypothetical protein HYU22_04855 [Candidatus Woesearchaeota archaeon]|nr:hypothetical protein [Candidatus Woesearchaeota archaeon]